MEIINFDESLKWCLERGVDMRANAVKFLSAKNAKGVIILSVPEEYGRNIYLSDIITSVVGLKSQPTMLVVLDHSIGSEEATQLLFEKFRKGNIGIDGSVDDLPGHLSKPEDYDAVYGLILLSLLGGWNFVILPEDGRHFVFGSHDGYVDIVPGGPEEKARIMKFLDEFKVEYQWKE